MTRATRLGASALSTVLVIGLGTLAAAVAKASPATGTEAGTGSTAMPDQVLRRGCRTYDYSYSLAPTTGDWTFETFLVDPDGHTVSSGMFASGSDPNPGTAGFGLCRGITRFGRFTIRGKLTTYDGWDQATAWIAPTTVRLHRWGR